MDKQSFLCNEYERMIGSGEYVWSGWRDSFERFQADLWDMTPTSSAGRYLAPKDRELGFSPDNVEWHFRKTRPIGKMTKVRKNKIQAPPSRTKKVKRAPLTAAEKKNLAETAKEERRRKLAEEFEYWERKRNSSSGGS
ncbi:hypothetical protein SAMN05880582_101536 [Rhizobium sp. RU20A]|jgi:hypothetical protein|uniref:hypothetical protein n=1 Tax=Rhizobium TaxID=379 RepID=UPI0009569494|nr:MULTISPECIES: hypothetical protein [Rhizobium]MDG3576959.1 hypothetical protein [Rhizobium sp. YJ-22]SIQ05026.1 hypothetical protein SAMN05880582_101536 [Rhizobium sp. RU20A]